MRRNTQLTQDQRYQIQVLMKAGLNQTETVLIVCVHKSTICREFKRNTGLRWYRPKQAHRLYGIVPLKWRVIFSLGLPNFHTSPD